MLAPKKVKRRKPFRPDVRGVANRATAISFGTYGLKAETGGWVKSNQIEAARRVIARYIRKGGKTWIRIFPDRAITMKGTQSVMGSGKGIPDHYIAVVKPGTMIFELDGIPVAEAKEALTLAGHKFPVKCKFIVKN